MRAIGLIILLLIACLQFLAGSDASAEISSRGLSELSDEVDRWDQQGYSLEGLIISDIGQLRPGIVVTLGQSPEAKDLSRLGVLSVYAVDGDGVRPIFERGFRWYLYHLEVRDIDRDSENEIVVDWGPGTGWRAHGIALFRMRDGRISPVELVPPVAGDEGLIPSARLVDLDGDGVCELMVLDTALEFAYGLCHACSPAASRVFSWDRQKECYQEMSSSFPSYYEGVIRTIEEKLKGPKFSWDYYVGDAISLYLNYYYKGEAEKGLRILKDLFLTEGLDEWWKNNSGPARPDEYSYLSRVLDDVLSKYPF